MNHDQNPASLPDDSSAAAFWQRATRRLARQINLGWWLSSWLPLAAMIGLTGMVVMLYARWRSAEAAPWVWGSITLAFAAAGVAAWWRSRRHFETQATARVRLEESLSLHARLTAATAGVGPWPQLPSPADARWPISWQWQRPAGVVAFIGVMLAASAWVPIAGAGSSRPHTIEKPTDARMVEQWIEELETAELIDEHSADEIHRRIEQLTERPAEEWYEHASLEAAGTLKEQTAAAMQELAENVAAAERAAATLDAMQASLPQPLRESLAGDLAAAVTGLELGEFQPAGDLAGLLGELRPADLGELSPEELAALAKRLAANRDLLREALSRCQGFDMSKCQGLCEDGSMPCSECEGCKAGKACQKPGRGGLSRGRGDAELSFGEANDLGTRRVERIQQEIDAERAAPDAVLAVVDGEHDVDESAYTGPTAGGGIATEGDGGVAVEIDTLLPAEQAAVKRFFE